MLKEEKNTQSASKATIDLPPNMACARGLGERFGSNLATSMAISCDIPWGI